MYVPVLRGCHVLFLAVHYFILCYRNGSHTNIAKEEGLKLNGVHDVTSCNSSTVTSLKASKDQLQKNGYVHPLNGALKQQDSISCSKSTHQGAEFRCPQPKAEETGTSGCSYFVSDLTASTVSTSLPPSPSRATQLEQISDLSLLSMQPPVTFMAIQEKHVNSESLLGQDRTSVRLNGSHHIASNVTQTDKQSAQGPETGIISEFFSHSRLHHISTWRNEFSEYVNTLQSRRRAAGGAMFSGKDKLKKLRNDHCAGNGICCIFFYLFLLMSFAVNQ